MDSQQNLNNNADHQFGNGKYMTHAQKIEFLKTQQQMTKETKQTAVDKFANEVYQIIENYDVDKMRYHIEKAHKKAEKINKAQHGNTWGNALSAVAVDKWESFEQYYAQTYGGNNE